MMPTLQQIMASKDLILKVAERYLRIYPVPEDIFFIQGLFKLSYSRSNPYINAKNTEEVFVPLKNIQINQKMSPRTAISNFSLIFDEKVNIIKQTNSFDGIKSEEIHEKVIQDDVFGRAHLNKEGNKWIYIAKKKAKKPKSYFLGGSGQERFVKDFGETYEGINNVGIFLWDMENKKISEVEVNLEGDTQYIFANPIFANDEGTKIICHGYKRTQFTHGLLHCFNRPVSVFEISIDNLKSEKLEVKSRILIDKEQTCIFANISSCRNYLLYFGGHDITHTYYMDLVILKRCEQLDQEEGKNIGEKWEQIHRKKNAFVGYYNTAKSETFEYNGEPYALYQTIDRAKSVIKEINLKTGEERLVAGEQTGTSYQISRIYQEEKMLVGKVSSHSGSNFFYAPFGGKVEQLPHYSNEDPNILLQEFDNPIHGYYLQSKEDEIKREKKPLIVLVHGGPHGSIEPTLTMLRYIFLKLGYAILMPNFSGSVGFGPEYLKNALGNIGQTDAKEIIGLLEKVLSQKPHLDKENIHVMGGSYGGYMGGILSSRYHKHFKSCIIMNGVISIAAMMWFSDIPEWGVCETLKSNEYHNLTQQNYEQMFKQSPCFEPVKIPILQFLGAKDLRVPPKQGHLFDAITKKNGINCQTYVYEEANHSLADSIDTIIDVAMKSVMFFENIKLDEEK